MRFFTNLFHNFSIHSFDAFKSIFKLSILFLQKVGLTNLTRGGLGRLDSPYNGRSYTLLVAHDRDRLIKVADKAQLIIFCVEISRRLDFID